MRRSLAAWASVGRRSRSVQSAQLRDLRHLRGEHVTQARERIFGPQGNMPGDRFFRKKLEGRELARWYFPSKYSFQDFRVDEYFEMQAERFAPRTPHKCMARLNTTAEEVAKHREELRRFFRSLDEETFLSNPTLQDLYGMFRLVDPEPALSFPVPENIFMEHTPLWGASPPFRYPSQGLDEHECLDTAQSQSTNEHEWLDTAQSSEATATTAGQDQMPEELLALRALVGEKLTKEEGRPATNALDARLNRLTTQEEVRTLLLQEATKLGIIAPFEDSSVVVENGKLSAYLVRAESGGSEEDRAKAKRAAEEELEQMRATKGPVRQYLARRHRFVDPMFRRRRLKWLERQMAGKNKEREVKYNSYYATHPDDHKVWPTNKGSVTVTWPSPYH